MWAGATYLRTLLVGLQHISASPDGMDQFLRPSSVDLVPEIVHIDVDDIRKRIEVLIPDMV